MYKIFYTVICFFMAAGCTRDVPTVLYVNSYHQGYPSSDSVMTGIQSVLDKAAVEWETIYMDSKRNPRESEVMERADEVLQHIRTLQPDILIVSDDNAVKYLTAAHYKNGPIPTVFCGVNWSCEQYGLPTDYVAGMLEVVPLQAAIALVRRYYPEMRRLTILTENSTSAGTNRDILTPVFQAMDINPGFVLVENFDVWKAEFVEANAQSDAIFLPTNGAVRGWQDAEAAAFVRAHIRVPVFTCDDFMMEFSVMGITKVASEQGEWAAQTALDILDGKKPSEIPVTRNSRTQIYWNRALAGTLGLQPDKLKSFIEWK